MLRTRPRGRKPQLSGPGALLWAQTLGACGAAGELGSSLAWLKHQPQLGPGCQASPTSTRGAMSLHRVPSKGTWC